MIGLIHRMAAENPTWGEEQIADELFLKLHIRLSPRTVGKHLKRLPHPRGTSDQRWSTFLHDRHRAFSGDLDAEVGNWGFIPLNASHL